jgi:hypothetical protein
VLCECYAGRINEKVRRETNSVHDLRKNVEQILLD